MSNKRTSSAQKAHDPVSSPGGPSAGSLAALVALGVLSALWALFLWTELVLYRSTGTPACALGDGSGCVSAWGSAFASAVRRLSGLPVAGWGLAWGVVALALPLGGLLRLGEGRGVPPQVVSAVRLTAGAGVVSVFALMAVSATEGAFCSGCFVTYVLVAGYAGIALFGWPRVGLPAAPKGLALAATATIPVFLLLLYPGSRTPQPVGEAGRQAIAEVTQSRGLPASAAAGTGDPEADQRLKELVESLNPQLRQTLSDSLLIYRSSPQAAPPAPRRLQGPAGAPVRITEWTDVLCDHCADLHVTLASLREHLPEGSFSVDAREFPLDGACNPLLRPREGESVRCFASKARLCLEDHPRSWDFSQTLFENQKNLTEAKVRELAAPFADGASFEQCIVGAETQAKLEEDVRLAARFEPDGTPIVAVNGRRGTSFGPFLFAMVLTRGVASHPAFQKLPAPNPNAHLH
jgi:serine/threonine-protein kinase